MLGNSYSPAGTLAGGHKRSGCLHRPTEPLLMAGSAGKLYVPPCHDRGPLLTGCQMPSWCLHAVGWTVCPMGCVASLEHPPTLEYLKQKRKMSDLYSLHDFSFLNKIQHSSRAHTVTKFCVFTNNTEITNSQSGKTHYEPPKLS